MDPDTGKIDIDRVGGGTPRSDMDKMKKIQEEIELLEQEFERAPIDVIIENMGEKYEMSPEKVESLIRTLKQKGVIFEPRNGFFNTS